MSGNVARRDLLVALPLASLERIALQHGADVVDRLRLDDVVDRAS
jgi:hypothetical protein